MDTEYVDIASVEDVHRFYCCGRARHPLLTLIDFGNIPENRGVADVRYRTQLFIILCKRMEGGLRYGAGHYDFREGTLLFMAPNQVFSPEDQTKVLEGWGLFVHPDLLYGTALGDKMNQYSFFHYGANEALHISQEEKTILLEITSRIEKEYGQNIDHHTHELIVDHIQLLLNYCNRFYDRQFLTRTKAGNDIVQRFEKELKTIFSGDRLVEYGLPDVKYFSSLLHLSPNYLSDVLKRFTGKTTQELIHLEMLDKAKQLLLGTEKNISEIAFELGFDHPSHFTKLFKSKQGISPKEFRSLI